MTARGLIIAAPRSGAGKTTVTLALLAALQRRGVKVSAAKAGPDYIDPAFHAAATGRAGRQSRLLGHAAGTARRAGGASSRSMRSCSSSKAPWACSTAQRRAPAGAVPTADLAARFGLPVLLVIDVARASAIGRRRGARLCQRTIPRVRIAGVVLNRVGSERHRALVADAITGCGMPILGAMPREAAITLPERHLGLVQAAEHGDLAALSDRLALMAETPSRSRRDCRRRCATHAARARQQQRRCSAAARTAHRAGAGRAFSFVYPHVAGRLARRRRGDHRLSRRWPMKRRRSAADSCWLPGGYPELHAEATRGSAAFSPTGLRRFAATRPVHGECGGYMVLGESIEDADGRRHAMTGLLGHATSFAKRKLHLGYREARVLSDSVLGAEGARVRGHEFHYASLASTGRRRALLPNLRDAQGRALGNSGGRRGNVSGTFFHAIAADI